MAILSSQATRRDAKSYFGRFAKPEAVGPSSVQNEPVPLSSLPLAPVRTAVVKVCRSDILSSVDILPGLAKTVVQLGKLGMPSCLILEPADSYGVSSSPLPSHSPSFLREINENMVYRVADAIEAQGGRAQPLIGEVFTRIDSVASEGRREDSAVLGFLDTLGHSVDDPSISISPLSIHLLRNLLFRNVIPVVAPIASGPMPSLSSISGDCGLFKICAGLAGSSSDPRQLSVERVIIVDPIGGLPAQERQGASHVYINLRQEFDNIVEEMSANILSPDIALASATKLHLRNLAIIKMCLGLLRPTSSALITTPAIAASKPSQTVPQSLIHNLLTDKPLISPSLPPRRSSTPVSKTTLLRLGMPVEIFTSLAEDGADDSGPRFEHLVSLIEDSFGRRLSVAYYKSRLRDRTAAIIIAGDYEGAAIVTKETVPGTEEWIYYLDKFAVSSKSQGSQGVADVVFNVLVSLFPDSLIWRSRKNNPVNKWVRLCSPLTDIEYFERARGAWKVPRSNWTVFWTFPHIDPLRFEKYVEVVESIGPSWQ
jgi:amino-acid N-acetyltransferase